MINIVSIIATTNRMEVIVSKANFLTLNFDIYLHNDPFSDKHDTLEV